MNDEDYGDVVSQSYLTGGLASYILVPAATNHTGKQRPFIPFFAAHTGRARRAYVLFVGQGLRQGQRSDLSGGGLKRSYGGWQEITGGERHQRLKSDERILGGSTFVQEILGTRWRRLHKT